MVVRRPVAFVDDPELAVTVAFEPLPYPDPGPSDGDRAPPEEAALMMEDPVAVVAAPDPLDVVIVAVDVELEEVRLVQERSKRGVVLKVFPSMIPKLGFGVAPPSVSSRVYQKMLVLPKRGHPTASQ